MICPACKRDIGIYKNGSDGRWYINPHASMEKDDLGLPRACLSFEERRIDPMKIAVEQLLKLEELLQ